MQRSDLIDLKTFHPRSTSKSGEILVFNIKAAVSIVIGLAIGLAIIGLSIGASSPQSISIPGSFFTVGTTFSAVGSAQSGTQEIWEVKEILHEPNWLRIDVYTVKRELVFGGPVKSISKTRTDVLFLMPPGFYNITDLKALQEEAAKNGQSSK
jgi:hypothetical protein